jgi:hypothetical protein
MATDFAVFLRRFLTTYLAGLRGCSANTVSSYRDAFKLLIAYFRDERSIPPGKLTLDCVDVAAITGYLNWLETSRGNSVSTRNQRLAAINSFCAWMQAEDPARMACYQDILAIPAKKQALLTPMWVESRMVWRADQRGLSWLGARASRRFGSLSQHRALESTRARFDPTQSCPEPRRRDRDQRPSGQRARRRPGGGSTAPAAPSDGLSLVLVPDPAPVRQPAGRFPVEAS